MKLEEFRVSRIKGNEVYAKDDEGIEMLVTKTVRANLKVGDRITGYVLNDDDDPDTFYIELHSKL